MAEKPKFDNHLLVRKFPEKGYFREIRAQPNLEELQSWVTAQREEKEKSEEAETEKSQQTDETSEAKSGQTGNSSVDAPTQLAQLQDKFYRTISSYHTLIFVYTSIMPIYSTMLFEREIEKKAEKEFERISSDDEFQLYGMSADQWRAIQPEIRRLLDVVRATAVQPNAILLSLVATFDSVVAETLRILLRANPERYSSSDKQISYKNLLSMTSFDDAIEHAIEEEIASQMRGSHEEQVKFIKENLDLDIRKGYDEWPEYVELFERRNLVAHGDLVANVIYINNCKRNGYDVSDINPGDRLTITSEYLINSARRLMEFGLLLIFVLWRKHFPDSDGDAYDWLNGLTFDMLRHKENHVAARVLDFAINHQPTAPSERTQKMMIINWANAQKKLGHDGKCSEIIDKVDWSASSDEFKISLASLREDVPEFVRLMPIVDKAGLVSKEEYREWPVFDWVRDHEDVLGEFQKIYGEPLLQLTSDMESSDTENSDENDETARVVH